MSQERLTEHPIYKRLREVRPKSVVALLNDGDARELAITGTKGKWERVLKAALSLDADGLELRDAEGRVLEILAMREESDEAPAAPAALEPAFAAELPATDPHAASVGYLTALVLRSAQVLTDQHFQHTQRLLDGAVRMMEVSNDRLAQVELALAKVLDREERRLLEAPEPREPSPPSAADQLMMQLAGEYLKGQGFGGLLPGGKDD